MRRMIFVILAGAFVPAPTMAQETLLLRHRPRPGTVIRAEFTTATTVWAFDGKRFESADGGVVRTVALAGPGEMRISHLAYESVTTRSRGSDGRWREFEVPGADSAWVQVTMDEQMRVQQSNYGQRLPGVTSLQRILTGIPDLELPGDPLEAGDRWSSPTITSAVPGLRNETVPPTVNGTAQLVLDSIVIRSRDTLGYVTVTGRFPAATFVDELGPGRVVLSGDLAGNLIWSTSWNGFVSGVSRTRMTMVREKGQEGVPGGGGNELRSESTTRYQVKP